MELGTNVFFRMNVAAGPRLAAEVTNAGGMGVIGGVGYKPKVLRDQVRVSQSPIEQPRADDLLQDPRAEGPPSR